AMEGARPMLTEAEREQIEVMRTFQKLMGDTRDLEILRVELEHWANKKGKTLAVIPALRELEAKRQALLDKLPDASQNLSPRINTSAAAFSPRFGNDQAVQIASERPELMDSRVRFNRR